MDTLTHAGLGALLALAVRERADIEDVPRIGCAGLGAMAAAFPDLDYLSFWLDPLRFHAEWHRGPTHSLVLLPFWAALIAFVAVRLSRGRIRLGPAAGIAALGLASHVFTDVITVYGTQIFFPLSRWRASLAQGFVLDFWFSLLVFLPLALAWRKTRLWARLGLLPLVLYLGGQQVLRQEALALAQAETKSWPGARAYVYPQPLSPYHWLLLLETGEDYRLARVNLDGESPALLGHVLFPRLAARYQAPAALDWEALARFGAEPTPARTQWQHPALARFRAFAHHGRLYRIDRDGAGACYWYSDLVFELPDQAPPFRYGLCRRDGAWRPYRLRLFSENERQAL